MIWYFTAVAIHCGWEDKVSVYCLEYYLGLLVQTVFGCLMAPSSPFLKSGKAKTHRFCSNFQGLECFMSTSHHQVFCNFASSQFLHRHQWQGSKGQKMSKWIFQDDVSSKKRTNEFDFTTMRLVFVRFLEEIEDTKKTFRNHLTFRMPDR